MFESRIEKIRLKQKEKERDVNSCNMMGEV
jgi:hypothetical protein